MTLSLAFFGCLLRVITSASMVICFELGYIRPMKPGRCRHFFRTFLSALSCSAYSRFSARLSLLFFRAVAIICRSFSLYRHILLLCSILPLFPPLLQCQSWAWRWNAHRYRFRRGARGCLPLWKTEPGVAGRSTHLIEKKGLFASPVSLFWKNEVISSASELFKLYFLDFFIFVQKRHMKTRRFCAGCQKTSPMVRILGTMKRGEVEWRWGKRTTVKK